MPGVKFGPEPPPANANTKPSPEQERRLGAQLQATALAEPLARDFRLLGDLLDRHEAVIRKRWDKKTRQKKKQLLVAAWGADMPASHRPDVKHHFQLHKGFDDLREAYLCPSVNQEDLSSPKHLLMMLHSRSRDAPPEFVDADANAMALGIELGVLKELSFPDLYMPLMDFRDPRLYAMISGFENGPAERNFGPLVFPSPGKGLLILESQQKIMSFLVACVKLIMQEPFVEKLLESPVQPRLGQVSVGTDDLGFPSLPLVASAAPYLSPMRLDLSDSERLLEARATAAEDHMWALREDPAYFASALLEHKEHRDENLKDNKGHEYRTLRNIKRDPFGFWKRPIGEFVTHAHEDLENWNHLARQAFALRNFDESEAFRHLLPKPKELLERGVGMFGKAHVALVRFVYTLRVWMLEVIQRIARQYTSSVPWRPFYSRLSPQAPGTHVMKSPSNIDRLAQEATAVREFDWLVNWLCRPEGGDLDYKTIFAIVDELQHLMHTESVVRSMLTSHVTGLFSDLSLLVGVLQYVAAFPGYKMVRPAVERIKGGGLAEGCEKYRDAVEQIIFALSKKGFEALANGMPTDGRFFYPSGQRRTRQNTESMRLAEHNLDKFWAGVDDAIFKHEPKVEQTALHELMQQRGVLRRTAEWTEPLPVSPSFQVSDVVDAQPFWSFHPISNYCIKRGKTPRGGSKNPHEPGDQSTSNDAPPAIEGSHEETHDPVQYTVPIRAYKAFATLFYTPSTNASATELPWIDFLYAMTSLGFAAEKLQGSSWQFTPPKGDDGGQDREMGRILFHEPHPSKKLSFWNARHYGRRLNRTYGWDHSSFVVANNRETKQEELHENSN